MLTRLRNSIPVFQASGFSLQDIEGFPYDAYEKQRKAYELSESWYKGTALDNDPQQAQSGKKADLYPMRINPIRGTVQKHGYALFGEVENDGRPLVVTKLIPPETGEETDAEDWKRRIQHAENILSTLWWENTGRELMMRNALMSQIYGGCVFKATWVPWEGIDQGGWRQIPIRLEAPNPKTFVGVPDGTDFFRLAEAWVVRQIDEAEAKRLGYVPKEGEELWYNERWTKEVYACRVNNQLIVKVHRGVDVPLGGANPWGGIPIVYIPHIRDIDFLGSNAFDHVTHYVKELNLRYGDFGDATNDDAHPIIAMRDVSGSAQMRRVTDWLEVVDLGQTTGITGHEKPPDMFDVQRQKSASAAMRELIEAIWTQYCRDVNVPAVALGEDEGSQRSGVTLAMRFWPLGSHVSTERYFWTAGLDVFQPILLRMMQVKNVAKITKEHLLLRMKQIWAPLLPRDREADVDEWATRSQNDIGSPEHLLQLAGDVEDVPEERARMLKWISDKEEAKQKAIAKYAMEEKEAEIEGQMELADKQGETQLEIADKNAKAAANRPAPFGGAK